MRILYMNGFHKAMYSLCGAAQRVFMQGFYEPVMKSVKQIGGQGSQAAVQDKQKIPLGTVQLLHGKMKRQLVETNQMETGTVGKPARLFRRQ